MSETVTHIGEYRVVRELAPGAGYLCLDDAGRRVVLKRLDADCLLGAQLHPSIKDRLMRIRELAHRQIATLRTVERTPAGEAWLVWDYIEGEPLEQHVPPGASVPPTLARDITLVVEALHALGIVHGALHARNIIVGPDRQVRLTHISPLLYGDPAEDMLALHRLLGEPAAAQLNDGSDLSPTSTLRMRSIVAAVAVAFLAIATSVLLYRAAMQSRAAPSPQAFERLDVVTPPR